jgi:hypothetical protein
MSLFGLKILSIVSFKIPIEQLENPCYMSIRKKLNITIALRSKIKMRENFMLIRIIESEFNAIIRTIINLISTMLILEDL